MPVSGNPRHDPDNLDSANNSNFFHQMLFNTRDMLAAGGKRVTADEAMINVYEGSTPDVPPETPFESFLAEGCTGYGFETWILVQNSDDREARVSVSFHTEEGPRNAEPPTVPARSRLTMNASGTIWAKSPGIRVGSDLPVFVERAMYWDERSEGHSSEGTAAGAREWYLAEGCTAYGFETWVTVLNPRPRETEVEVRFMGVGGKEPGTSATASPRRRGSLSSPRDAPPTASTPGCCCTTRAMRIPRRRCTP